MQNGSSLNAKPWWKSRLIRLMAIALLGTWSSYFMGQSTCMVSIGTSMAAIAAILLRFEDLNKLPPKD